MSKSTEVAPIEAADLPAEYAELEAELAAQNQEDSDPNDLQIPLLKIGQGQTVEVVEGDAIPGEFINTLTREGLGRNVQFIVSGFQKGRFDHGIRGEQKARKAYGTKTVPWRDDPFYGQPFSEHPDAEEQYARRANAGEIEWGKGPKISTTWDFTGFVVEEPDEDTGEVERIPVCLSLMRMNKKQAQKWTTLLDAVLRGKYWDAVFELSTEQQRNDEGNFYTINVKKGRKTTPDEKQFALNLALALRQQNVEVVGDVDEAAAPSKPADTDGLEV